MTEMGRTQEMQRKLNELNRMINPSVVPNGDSREAMQNLIFEVKELLARTGG